MAPAPSADLTADVVVIGGGPGGSTTATMLARQGWQVLLLERERFPRDHIGESLLPASIPVLEELGVLPAVQAADPDTVYAAAVSEIREFPQFLRVQLDVIAVGKTLKEATDSLKDRQKAVTARRLSR